MSQTRAVAQGLRSIMFTCITSAVVFWGLPPVLAAANIVPVTGGDGTSGVSGFTATDVAYTFDANNPENVDQVDFVVSVAPAAGTRIKVRLNSADGPWYVCTNVTTAVSCVTDAPQATVATSDELRIVIGN